MSEPQTLAEAMIQLRAAARDYVAAYDVLMADADLAAQSPETWNQWQYLKDYADGLRSSIDELTSAYDGSVGWLSTSYSGAIGSILGAMGLSGVRNNLGILPVLGIAAIVAAVAALVWVTGEIYKFHATLTATPEELQNLQTGAALGNTGGFMGTGFSVPLLVLGAAILYFAAPKIKEHSKRLIKTHAENW